MDDCFSGLEKRWYRDRSKARSPYTILRRVQLFGTTRGRSEEHMDVIVAAFCWNARRPGGYRRVREDPGSGSLYSTMIRSKPIASDQVG